MSIIILLITIISMEGFTWIVHKYVMHGWLWFLHKDHHDHQHDGQMEKNDWFFVIFALPAIALLYYGVKDSNAILLSVGTGVTTYGMLYFLVHDIFIHQRIALLRDSKSPYLLALRRAHKQHHKHLGKEDGECFGFLWVPKKYFNMYFNKRK